MLIDRKLTESVSAYLRPGERLQAVAAGQTVEPFILANAVGVGVILALGTWEQFPLTIGLFGHLAVAAVIVAIPMLLVLLFNRFRILAVTNERIVLLKAGLFQRFRARGIVGEGPRANKLLKDTDRDSVAVKVQLNGQKARTIYVRHAFLPQLREADQHATNTLLRRQAHELKR